MAEAGLSGLAEWWCPRLRHVYSEIASNKRRSVIFIGLFFVVWVAIGAGCGFLFKALYHQPSNNGLTSTPPTNYGWAPVIVGMVIAGLLALIGILYSLTSGAALVLRVSGAVPADPTKYAQLHNLVESLAIAAPKGRKSFTIVWSISTLRSARNRMRFFRPAFHNRQMI